MQAVHCFTQRLDAIRRGGEATANPLPLIGVLLMLGKETEADLSSASFYLRVYGADARYETTMEALMQTYQEIELDYVPSCLESIVISNAQAKGLLPGAFLVSGSKREIHVYGQTVTQQFVFVAEANQWCEALPASFPKLRTQVMCAQLRHCADGRVVAAFGCEDGSVLLTIDGVERQRAQLDGPITCVNLFALTSPQPLGRTARQELWAKGPHLINWAPSAGAGELDWSGVSSKSARSSADALNALGVLRAARSKSGSVVNGPWGLCVGGAVGFAVVFEDLEKNGLDKAITLPGSSEHDSVLAVASGDFTGHCEDASTLIALGTYGGTLLLYRRQPAAGGWCLASSVAYGPPIYALSVLRHIDVVPFLIVGSATGFGVMAPAYRSLEALVRADLEKVARLSVNPTTDEKDSCLKPN